MLALDKMDAKQDQKGPEGRRVEEFSLELCKGGPTLFSNRGCPFGHRAWWAALEKQVQFDYIHVDLGPSQPASYALINPYESVPCYYDGGRGVFESINIAEFFEERYPGQGTQLMPTDPVLRAAVREVISKFGPSFLYSHLKNQDLSKKAEFEKNTREEMEWFAGIYGKISPSGPYFLGDTLSLAEFGCLTFFERFDTALKHYRDFELLPANNPKLAKLRLALETVRQRPAWQACAQKPEYFIQTLAAMGGKTDKELLAEQSKKE